MASKENSKNWGRVAALYAKIANEDDPESPTAAGNRQILNVINETLPLDKTSYILDQGCGNGQVINSILASPVASSIPKDARIVASDFSEEFVEMVKTRKQQRINEGQTIWEKVEVQRWDGTDLRDVKDNDVSHITGGYAFFAMKEEKKALAEALRVLKPGGVLVETSMGVTDWGFIPSFLKEVRPDKQIPGPGVHWHTAAGVRGFLEEMGFKDPQARQYPVSIPFESYEEAIEFPLTVFPFVKGLMADMSEEEVGKARELMLKWLEGKYPGGGPFRMQGISCVGWRTK